MKKSPAKIDVALSPLEADVLAVLWPNQQRKVREIYTILKPKRKVALSSIAVILDRLYEKQIVDRKVETGRGGLRYIYFPIKNKVQFERSVIESTVDKLINKFGSTAITYFNDRFQKKIKH